MITIERLEKSLTYLSDTDEDAARAKAYMFGVEDQKHTVLGIRFLESDHKTVEKKKAEAYTSLDYERWREKRIAATVDYEILRNKRTTETLIIEVWRSLNAARTKGVII